MRTTNRLLNLACRITLFQREGCGLCTQARSVLSEVWDKRPFAYTQVDIMKPESKSWRDMYDFDVPVVRSEANETHLKYSLHSILASVLNVVYSFRFISANPNNQRRTPSYLQRQ